MGYRDACGNARLFTNLLTAILPGPGFINIVPHWPHLGLINLVMVKIFPGNPCKGSVEDCKNSHRFFPSLVEVVFIFLHPLIWLAMPLALANGTSVNTIQAEA